ncbi:MAG: DNA repair protein RecN [Bacillota bacterium]|nr:DNA repair protein RecN [Bacillota bacterium]
MLYELYVENFALIRELRLQLGDGLNALTGETGAGKSLIIDAVSLLIGGRGNDALIRGGDQRCRVEGVFLPPFAPQIAELMPELAADIAAGDNLILSRELIRGGRSSARINNHPLNITLLKQIGRLLVNIHGQREFMLLLDPEQQLRLLDRFGGTEQVAAAEQTARLFELWREQQQRLERQLSSQQQRDEELERLSYMLDEIEQAQLHEGEDEQLRRESQRLANGEKLYGYADAAAGALSGSGAAVEQISVAYTALRHMAELDHDAEALRARMESLYYEAGDIAREIAAYKSAIDLDAFRLDDIEARLDKLSRLKKKYGGSIAAALEEYRRAKLRYTELEELNLSSGSLQAAAEQAEREYMQAARQLSARRAAAADKLGAAITEELRLLSMPQAQFSVELTGREPSADGLERAVYMITPNPGEAAQPVAAIASGGELSRIVLGIKVILARLDEVPTLIFDEVDSGLSGKALVAVAQRLALVGQSAQTVIISHAAVMAAAASCHILIEKHPEQQRTVIGAITLDGEARLRELARMIAGDKAGDVTIEQAREMLRLMQ